MRKVKNGPKRKSGGQGVVPQEKRYDLLASVPTVVRSSRFNAGQCMYCGRPGHKIDTCFKALDDLKSQQPK